MAVALQLAVVRDEVEIVETLFECLNSEIVNQRSLPLGRTLLHVAVRNNSLRVAQVLLEAKADVNAFSEDNLSALHIAVGNRSVAMVELLLHYGANVNPERRFNGKTPLYMAVEYSCVEIAKLLLEKGAKVASATGVIQLALRIGCERMAKLLLEFVDEGQVNAKSHYDDKSPLCLAIENGQFEVVEQLVKRGANINEVYVTSRPDENGNDQLRSPLSLAVHRGDEKTVLLLLNYGATHLAEASLQRAIKLRCKKIVELLLTSGAVKIDVEVDGKTALCVAVEYGYKDMIKLCLAYGASLDKLGDHKRTQLLYNSVRCNDAELLEALLNSGASANAYVSKNVRLLDVAVKARFVSSTKLLLKHRASINAKSSREDKLFALKYATLLLSEGYKIEEANRKIIRSNDECRAFYEKCRAELKRARKRIFVGDVTYLDLLRADDNALASYVQNEKLVEQFPNCGYRDDFPIYADTIALCYAKGRLRNALLKKAMLDIEHDFGTPLGIANKVFSVMNNDELKNLIRSVCQCPDGRHVCLPEIYIQF